MIEQDKWEELEEAIAKVGSELIGLPRKCAVESVATVDDWNDGYITIILFPSEKQFSEVLSIANSTE